MVIPPKAKTVLIAILSAIVLLFLIDFVAQISYRYTTVAVVNGEIIKRQDFEDLVMQTCGQGILEDKIKDVLIKQEIKKANVKVSEKEISNQIDEDIAQFGDEKEYWESLKQQGITKEELREQIKTSLAMAKLLRSTITNPSAEQIAAYYKEHKDQPEFQKAGLTQQDIDKIAADQLIAQALVLKMTEWPDQLMEEKKVKNYLFSPPPYLPFDYIRRVLLNQ